MTKRNIAIFYILIAATNFWFIASNWVYFWTRFMTFGQLGWVDGIAFGFALLLDIPTGALADLLGKKRTIIFAMLSGLVGTFFIATANSLPGIFIGWMITQMGYAFYSGTSEALTYDTLVQNKQEEKFDKVVTTGHALESYVGAATTFIGGFLYVINFRLPHYLWVVGFFIGLVASFFLVEPKIDTEKFSIKKYIEQMVTGMKELFLPKIRIYFLYFLVLLGVYYLYSWGFIRPAMAEYFGFHAKEQSVIYAVLTVFCAVLVHIVPFLRRKLSNITGLTLLSIVMGLGFFMSSYPIGHYGFFAMLLIALGGKLAYPWVSIVVNKEINSKYRATTLSTIAFITKIPYVLFAIIAGQQVQHGHLNTFVLGVSVAIGLAVIASLIWYKVAYKHEPNEV